MEKVFYDDDDDHGEVEDLSNEEQCKDWYMDCKAEKGIKISIYKVKCTRALVSCR